MTIKSDGRPPLDEEGTGHTNNLLELHPLTTVAAAADGGRP